MSPRCVLLALPTSPVSSPSGVENRDGRLPEGMTDDVDKDASSEEENIRGASESKIWRGFIAGMMAKEIIP